MSEVDLDRLLVEVAAVGLRPPAPDHVAVLLDDGTWNGLALAAFQGKLSGLLLDAIEADIVVATGPQIEHALALADRWQERTDIVDRALVDACRALAAAGIPSIVLKGAATARRLYGGAHRRPYADADVLVPEASFGPAIRLLEAAGRTRFPERRPGFDERFAHAVTLRLDETEIDLHRVPVHPPVGDLVPQDVAFGREPVPVEVAGGTVASLPTPDGLVHAAMHLLLDPGGSAELLRARDVVAWCRSVPPRDAHDAADRWTVGTLLDLAVREAHHRLRLEEPDGFRRPPSRRDRRLLRLHRGDARLARLRSLPGLGARVRYAVAMARPSREYVDSLGHGRAAERRAEVLRAFRRR